MRSWERTRTADPGWPKGYPIPYITASRWTTKWGTLLLLSDKQSIGQQVVSSCTVHRFCSSCVLFSFLLNCLYLSPRVLAFFYCLQFSPPPSWGPGGEQLPARVNHNNCTALNQLSFWKQLHNVILKVVSQAGTHSLSSEIRCHSSSQLLPSNISKATGINSQLNYSHIWADTQNLLHACVKA